MCFHQRVGGLALEVHPLRHGDLDFLAERHKLHQHDLLFDIPVVDALAFAADAAYLFVFEIDAVPIRAEGLFEVLGVEFGPVELLLGAQHRSRRDQKCENADGDKMAVAHRVGSLEIVRKGSEYACCTTCATSAERGILPAPKTGGCTANTGRYNGALTLSLQGRRGHGGPARRVPPGRTVHGP